MKKGLEQAGRYFLLVMAVSFLGWAAETAFFFLCYGELWDRGFMTMPFCTIYGVSFLVMYLLLGVPGERHFPCPGGRPGRVLVYFFLSALIPTCLELITGFFFHQLFDLRLWSYTAYRFHFRGYICLEYALLWGLLLPVCMKYLFVPLKNRIFSLSAPCSAAVSGILALLAAADWTVNFSRQQLLLPVFHWG